MQRNKKYNLATGPFQHPVLVLEQLVALIERIKLNIIGGENYEQLSRLH